jgi:hypothetical protein
MERETGIEPATNSLEGCDSTTELLPRSLVMLTCAGHGRRVFVLLRRWLANRSPLSRANGGGEGRTRTFEAARATDLQSAAFDRFATSPTSLCLGVRVFDAYLADRNAQVVGAGEGI